MKSVLVKFRDKTFKNFTFVSTLCVFLVACGGQDSAVPNNDSLTPNSGDTTGPVITIKEKGTETVIEDIDGNLHYIPTLEINYQTADTVFFKSEDAVELSEIDGKIIGYRQDHTLGESYIDSGFVANDTYSGTIPPEKTTASGSLNVLNPEQQVITYTATDASGNTSTLKRFFNLIDEIPPKVHFVGDRDRIIPLNAIADDEGLFTDQEENLLLIDGGAYAEDVYITNNIDTTKSEITIRKLLPSNPEGGYEEVDELTTNELADYKIEYSFTDKSGNETTATRHVFVREEFLAKQAVFENGAVVSSVWSEEIQVYDQGINYNACNLGNDCPNIKTALVTDSGVGRDSKVLVVKQLDNNQQSGLFISSSEAVDLRGSKELGLLQLDIKREAGSDPYVRIWADCGYPCAGGESRQGPFEIGEWNRIYIPVRDILEGPTSRLDLQIVKAGLLFKSESSRDSTYRLDNVVWLCGEFCVGDNIDHVDSDWANADNHEDPDIGYNAPQQGNYALKYIQVVDDQEARVSINLATSVNYGEGVYTLTAHVYSQHNTDLAFELQNSNSDTEEDTATHLGSGWETLTYKFEDLTNFDITNISFYQAGLNDNTTIFVDDLTLNSRNNPLIKIDFEEDPQVTFTLTQNNGSSATLEEAPVYDGYTLVWSDEFNGNTVNPANWRFDKGYGFQGWGNGELQFYREENASVENGLLTITAQKHQPKIPSLCDPFNPDGVSCIEKKDVGYTSAKLKTEDLFEFRYGRVDVRAVAAKGQGLWSAIWMLGANHSEVGWPRSGEIDILDTIGGTRDGLPQEAMLVNNMYWNAAGSAKSAPDSLGSINQNGSAEYWLNEPTDESYQRPALWDLDNLPDWMAGPEIEIDSGVEDDPETIEDESKEKIRPLMLTGCEGPCIDKNNPSVHKTTVDVDNLPEFTAEGETDWTEWLDNGGSTETFSNRFHVFSLIWTEDKITFEVDGVETNSIDIVNALEQHYQQTFYLILNVAIGGNWPKAPTDSTAFPDGMLVDYVRVYQVDSDGDGIADYDWDGETELDQD